MGGAIQPHRTFTYPRHREERGSYDRRPYEQKGQKEAEEWLLSKKKGVDRYGILVLGEWESDTLTSARQITSGRSGLIGKFWLSRTISGLESKRARGEGAAARQVTTPSSKGERASSPPQTHTSSAGGESRSAEAETQLSL